MRKRSRGKFREHHADMLINLAKNTVGIREGVSGLSMDIRHILVQLEMLKNLIAEIEGEMEIALGRIPYSSKLLSIKGLGVVSVAGIIGEIGDFKKFKTRSEIMKLAGLDLYEISSGKMERTAEDLKKRKESAPEDTLLCGDPDHKKKWHPA